MKKFICIVFILFLQLNALSNKKDKKLCLDVSYTGAFYPDNLDEKDLAPENVRWFRY